jgi:hypothetical protein
MKDKRLPIVFSNSNKSHLGHNMGWNKDAKSCLNNCGIDKDVTLQNIDTFKNIVAYKLRRNCGAIKN